MFVFCIRGVWIFGFVDFRNLVVRRVCYGLRAFEGLRYTCILRLPEGCLSLGHDVGGIEVL